MSKGAYAKGTLPGAKELFRGSEVLMELYLQIGQDMDINPSAKNVYLSKLGYVVEALSSSPNTGDTRRSRTD